MKAGLLLFAALLAACAPSEPDAAQSARPSIVSLNPCTDAILAEVADHSQILAISHYSHDPRASSMNLAEARKFAMIGGTVEEVLALRPDIVVAGSFLPPSTAQAFRRLGIRVETFGIANNVGESAAQVTRLAALAGHAKRGAALNARIEAALAAARPSDDAEPRDALVWQQGGIVAGPESLVANLLQHAGLGNHAAARGLGQGAYLPLEQVLAHPPALLLTAGDQRAMRHPALKALHETRSEPLEPALLYCGGPTIVRAAERLAEIRRGAAS